MKDPLDFTPPRLAKLRYIEMARNKALVIIKVNINPHIYGQQIFDKGAKNTQWGNDNHMQKN